MLISFLSAWLVFKGGTSHLSLALGGLLFQFASILDGCDGEIAKLKFMESRLGEWVDTLADNTSYLVFFSAVIGGMYLHTGDTFCLMVGGVMLFLHVLDVSLIFLYLKHIGSGSGMSFNMAFSSDVPEDERGWFFRFCNSLKFVSRRDLFAAFFCILAVTNSIEGMYWFLVIGSGLLSAGILGFGGQMLRTRGIWAAPSTPVGVEKMAEKGSPHETENTDTISEYPQNGCITSVPGRLNPERIGRGYDRNLRGMSNSRLPLAHPSRRKSG